MSPEMLHSAIASKVRAVSGRIRSMRLLGAAGLVAILLGATSLLALLLRKLGLIDADVFEQVVVAGTGFALAGVVLATLRRVPKVLAARLIDTRYGLQDRTAIAVQFCALPAQEQTDFMKAAIEDATRAVAEVKTSAVLPFRIPRDFGPAAVLGLSVLALSYYSFPTAGLGPARAPAIAAIDVDLDDLDAYREYARALAERARAEDQRQLAEAAQALNRLIEDIAHRRIDREEAFRRLEELENRFLRGTDGSRDELHRQLREIANELARSELTKSTADALRTPDLRQAEKAMRDLAAALREKAPSKREIDRVREALARAAQERQDQSSAAEIERRQREVQRLLQKQREKMASDRERRLLQKNQRDLERLERNQTQREQARRNLERLRSEFEQAAAQMNNHPSDGADELEQAAEDINRMGREQAEDEEMRRLMQRLAEMRQMMRQQGRGGQKMAGRIQKFYKLARGGSGGQRVRMEMPGQGQQGQGQGQQGQGAQGQGQGQHQGPGGQNGDLVLRLGGQGDADSMLMLPGMGQQGQGQRGGPPGPGIGTQHDPNIEGQETSLNSRRQDTQVQGQQGEGPSRSQIIMTAADSGFASRSYRNVYQGYERVAEEDLDAEEVPPGYRYQIRTYFDRIRPQD